jgi:pimeloyl-ACP methyl ester carboxylesterase
VVGAGVLLGLSIRNNRRAEQAEREHPPIGHFIWVDGVRLHYVDRGHGDVVLLCHGNGSLIEDFLISGVVDRLASRYRVIAIDRPGFGYSTRPGRMWTPGDYGRLLAHALSALEADKVIVVGHSWGAFVAVALALGAPGLVRGLVLESGYFFPTPRRDTLLFGLPAIPILGDLMRHTVSPIISELMLPYLIKKIFAPAPVPSRFHRSFPKALAVRPSQLRAAAEDSALMLLAASQLQSRYRDLHLPVAIIAGKNDQIVDTQRQSVRLHAKIPGSMLRCVDGVGHMLHHVRPDQLVEAVDLVANTPNAGRSHGREVPD